MAGRSRNLGTANEEGKSRWTPYTPSAQYMNLSFALNNFTSASATGRYNRRGKTLDFLVTLTITTDGSTSPLTIVLSLPFLAKSGDHGTCSAGEIANTGKSCRAKIVSNSTTLYVGFYDGTYAGANGNVITIEGSYEIE